MLAFASLFYVYSYAQSAAFPFCRKSAEKPTLLSLAVSMSTLRSNAAVCAENHTRIALFVALILRKRSLSAALCSGEYCRFTFFVTFTR